MCRSCHWSAGEQPAIVRSMDIDIVLFDGFDELDAIAPYEVLRTAEALGADLHAELVGARGAGQVTAAHGTRLLVDRGPDEASGMLLVPGGGWNDRRPAGARAEVASGELPALLARAHAGGAVVASVCTGAMVLAAAGLTEGLPATTHHEAVEDLRATGALIVDARVVDDGDLLTAGGVTSGIDLALWIVEREAGIALARRTADALEHELDSAPSRIRRNERGAAQDLRAR
jgi:transcriptional regulator GlxA family with amidase domain